MGLLMGSQVAGQAGMMIARAARMMARANSWRGADWTLLQLSLLLAPAELVQSSPPLLGSQVEGPA